MQTRGFAKWRRGPLETSRTGVALPDLLRRVAVTPKIACVTPRCGRSETWATILRLPSSELQRATAVRTCAGRRHGRLARWMRTARRRRLDFFEYYVTKIPTPVSK